MGLKQAIESDNRRLMNHEQRNNEIISDEKKDSAM